MLEQAGCTLATTELKVTLGTKGRVSSNGDTKQLAVVDKGVLSQVRVDLDLEDLGLNSSVTLYIVDEGALGIAEIGISTQVRMRIQTMPYELTSDQYSSSNPCRQEPQAHAKCPGKGR